MFACTPTTIFVEHAFLTFLPIRLSDRIIEDPNSESESDDDDQTETISAKNDSRGSKRSKGLKKNVATNPASEDSNGPSNVIYLGHLPVGFEDREITVFLNQFGNVKHCRVSRSKKTGRSRGYAFVEFADAEVAKIVAETMSGYFLLEKRLVCHVLPMDKVHEKMFFKARRIITKKDRQEVARTELNKRRSAEAMKEITAKLVKRDGLKRTRLAELGIDYEFPGYDASAKSLNDSDISQSQSRKRKEVGGDENENDDTREVKENKDVKKRMTKSGDVVGTTGKTLKEANVTNQDATDANENETKSSTKKKKRKHQSKTPKSS